MPDLGQYAGTVLSAYGITAVLLIALVISSWVGSKAAKARLRDVEDKS